MAAAGGATAEAVVGEDPPPLPEAVTENIISKVTGLHLATYRWLPENNPPRALIFLVHGYGHHARGIARLPTRPLLAAGYGVFAMDHEGHGASGGKFGLIPCFANFPRDLAQFVEDIRVQFPGLKTFIVGESMGGATSVLACRSDGPLASIADGVVLVAPMVRISPSMKPPEWQIRMLEGLASIFPSLPITPVPSVTDKAFKSEAAKRDHATDPMNYDCRAKKKYWMSKPRLKTAVELNRTTMDIEEKMELLEMPLLIMHGKIDEVTEPESSVELHERAASKDKTIILIDDMPHGIFNAFETGSDRTVKDLLEWLEPRIDAPQTDAV